MESSFSSTIQISHKCRNVPVRENSPREAKETVAFFNPIADILPVSEKCFLIVTQKNNNILLQKGTTISVVDTGRTLTVCKLHITSFTTYRTFTVTLRKIIV